MHLCLNIQETIYLLFVLACLHGWRWGPQEGEITRLGGVKK